jgi:hypothetical protein
VGNLSNRDVIRRALAIGLHRLEMGLDQLVPSDAAEPEEDTDEQPAE